MSEVVVRPLLIVREHAGGAFAAHPAAAPELVCYGADRKAVLGELGLFLSAYLAKAGAESIQWLVLSEDAVLDRVSVALPYRGPARLTRLRSPLSLEVLFVPAERDARWVLVPSLDHVSYVPAERIEETHAIVARDIERLAQASDLDGGRYLDLFPPLATSVERIDVELEAPQENAHADAKRVDARKRRDARLLLERIGRPLVPAREAASVLHRGESARTLRALLEQRERASVVLVGPEGAGKSALVKAAVGTKTNPLGRLVIVTSGAELVAGQSFVGQLEERVEAVMKAAELLDAVLYFEAFDDLFAGRSGGYQDLASLMRRHVAEGKVRLLGELTAERHDRLQHRNVSFFSSLHQVSVEPLTRAQTLDVLRARKLSEETARVLLELTERYYPYAAQPGSAVRFADEVAALKSGEVQPDDVYRATSARTGVPEFLLRDERSLLLHEVVRHFRSQLIGQEAAIQHVAEVLCRVKAGVSPTGRPLATFLFVGPTGVGKTELAKALARFLFGSTDRLARFDMSEYMGPLAAERLIRGTDCEDGVLTRHVRQQPFTVLLLDEIEKADAGVFDLLLQVFGEGRLSDAQGHLAYFNNAIIIMTSNLGVQYQKAPTGFGSQPSLGREHYLREVREHFRPEFINRLDRIVAFEALTLEQMREVTELSIDRIKRRAGLDERNVDLQVSRGATLKLAEDGYSPAYGARGLRRHLEHALVAPIATVLAGLGDNATGSLVSVRLPSENETARGGELHRHEHGGLSIAAFSRPDPKRRNVTGAADISRLRREVTRLSKLGPLGEVRERIAEINAELSTERTSKRASAALAKVFGELSAEHHRLTAVLQPLDDTQKELEAIEGMVISAMDEGGAPELFAEEARQAADRYMGQLVPALVALTTDNEITLRAHELDAGRPLLRWLVPFLGYTKDKRWEVLVHFHRDEPTPYPEWPEDRRWGPPRSRDEVLERFAEELPFRNALVRVRGHAAGALLAFCEGRWVYPHGQGKTELLVRVAKDRFEIESEDQLGLLALVEPEIGRRGNLCIDVTDDPEIVPGGKAFDDVNEGNLFQNYERMIVHHVVASVGG